MKRKLLNILTAAAMITTMGLIMDEDVVEPNMLKRFVEFFAMIGIVFMLISALYFTFTFIQRRVQGL